MTAESRQEARERVKAQLNLYLDIKGERAQIERLVAELEGTWTAPGTSNWSGMPRSGGHGDPMTGGLMQKERLLERYHRKGVELDSALERIEAMIDSLEPRERKLLRHRYVEGLTWESVCVAMNYSWSRTHDIHALALDKLVEMA